MQPQKQPIESSQQQQLSLYMSIEAGAKRGALWLRVKHEESEKYILWRRRQQRARTVITKASIM